jgi:peptide-N4-(N-acetyl-beta-glucosaminyl)asparagine amidase
MAYCIAFSRDGAMDVTRRYAQDLQWMGDRTRATEEVLVHILDENRKIRRQNLNEQDRSRLEVEDTAEQTELGRGVATQLACELCKSLPGCRWPRNPSFVSHA